MGICYIFGAADGLPDELVKNDGDLIIAADSGINHLEFFGGLLLVIVVITVSTAVPWVILIRWALCPIARRLLSTRL